MFTVNYFCGFSVIKYTNRKPFWQVLATSTCQEGLWFVYFMTEVVFEKLRSEPAIPGLQGIALIHYTKAASKFWKKQYHKERTNANPTRTRSRWGAIANPMLKFLSSSTTKYDH